LPLLLAIESFAESRRSALHLRPARRTVTVETGAPPICLQDTAAAGQGQGLAGRSDRSMTQPPSTKPSAS
jgi:hypothetical protein